MSDLSPLSGVERKLDFGAVRSALDPKQTFLVWLDGWLPLSRLVHQIFCDRGFVPGQPEAMPARLDRAVDDLHRLGDDRAGEVEIFDPVRGRKSG